MKKLLLSAVMAAAALTTTHAQTQADNTPEPKKHKRTVHTRPFRIVYIGLSSGINNPGGVFGVDVETHVAPQVAIGAGFGSGTWGDKFHIEAKYYLHDFSPTWAFGVGYTHASGEKDLKMTLNVNDGTYGGSNQEVTMTLKPQSNVFLAAYKYWNLGKRNNKCFLELGYSMALASPDYEQTAGYPLSDKGNNTVKALSPGGLIAGFGFSFSITGDKPVKK